MSAASATAGSDVIRIPAPAPFPQEAKAGAPAPCGHPEVEAAMLRALLHLDPAIARWSRAQVRRDMVKRIWRGIADHFRLRATEWFAAGVLIVLGRKMYFPPPTFPTSESWRVMAEQMSEESWGLIFLGIGLLRLSALTINGTFTGFRFSPLIRCVTAFLACGLWLQVVMSIFESSPNGTGFEMYRMILILELYNLWRAGVDTGIVLKRSAGDD